MKTRWLIAALIGFAVCIRGAEQDQLANGSLCLSARGPPCGETHATLLLGPSGPES